MMQLQNLILALNFLFSLCYAKPMEPSSSNPTSRSRFELEPNHKFVDCAGRIYTALDLDTAAKEACSRYLEQYHCRDSISCYYIKKLIPAIPKVSMYNGPLFDEVGQGGPILRWPLPKRNLMERARYHAVILYDPTRKYCKTLGAMRRVGNKQYIKCDLKPFGNTQNGERTNFPPRSRLSNDVALDRHSAYVEESPLQPLSILMRMHPPMTENEDAPQEIEALPHGATISRPGSFRFTPPHKDISTSSEPAEPKLKKINDNHPFGFMSRGVSREREVSS